MKQLQYHQDFRQEEISQLLITSKILKHTIILKRLNIFKKIIHLYKRV